MTAIPGTQMPDVLTTVGRGVMWIRLNRPSKLNALSLRLATSLLEAVTAAAVDTAVRSVVITGVGRAFCAGDDIDAVAAHVGGDSRDLPIHPDSGESLYLTVALALVRMEKPVVAGINGATFGAGLEIACAADLRVCSSQAVMGSGLVKIGHAGTAVLLPRVVGRSAATEIYLSGRALDADEALRLGLVHRVFPAETFDEQLEALAVELAQKPTRAIGLFKRLREAAWSETLEVACQLQDAAHSENNSSIEDGAEGLAAFLAGRSPRFTGR